MHDEYFRETDVILGFEPFWLSAMLYFAMHILDDRSIAKKIFVVRVNMCPLLNYDVQFPQAEADDIFKMVGVMLLEEVLLRRQIHDEADENVENSNL